MKKKILQSLFNTLALVCALCCVQPGLAHGGEPRIEISSERLSPGEVLQIRGVDFESDEEVAITLVNSTSHVVIVSLGAVFADIEGGFTQNVVLPVDLLEGNYAFLAKTYDHETFSPPFTVWGIAAADGQESNIVVDQSDVQFGSVPTFTASVVPNDVLSQPTAQSPQPSSQSSMEARGVPVPILVMILLGALILIIFSARKLIQKK